MLKLYLLALSVLATAAPTQTQDDALAAALNPNPPRAGIFVDPVTNVTFELFDNRVHSDVETAFAAYLAAGDS